MLIGEFLLIFAFILLNGFFAMAEMALVSVRPARLKALADEGRAGAAAALKLAQDPNGFLSAVQIGITLVGVFASAYSGATIAEILGQSLNAHPLFAPHGEAWALAGVVALITFFTLIFGELLPKRLGLAYADKVALIVALPISGFALLTAPLVSLLKYLTRALAALFGVRDGMTQAVSEEEVKTLIAEGTQSGVFAPEEQRMIEGVLRLPDRSVRAIMTPRTDMVWLEAGAAAAEAMAIIRQHAFSRYPIARSREGGVDEEILGVITAKDLLDASLRGEAFDVMAHLHKPLFVLDTLPALRLLDMFRQTGVAMAIVLDEYGSVEGLVTVTDILEAIAGSFTEPAGTPPEDAAAVRRADGSWLLDGGMPIDDAAQLLDVRAMRENHAEYQTLAGFLLLRFGHLPRTGERTRFAGYQFEIMDLDGRRIDKVLVAKVGETAV